MTESQPMFSGVVISIGAGLMLAWAAYIYKVPLKSYFHSKDLQILTPIQLAIAPLILAKAADIAEEHDLRLTLNFRYSGKDALSTISEGDPVVAVASDVAACLFLGENPDLDLVVLPFARITGHLRLITANKELKSVDDLMNIQFRVGYTDNTVHEHFIQHIGIERPRQDDQLVKVSNILQSYNALVHNDVDAFILWEPHYLALDETTQFKNVYQIKVEDDYEWFLCLVANRSLFKDDDRLASRVLGMIKQSNMRCTHAIKHNPTELVEACSAYMFSEFTGINEEHILAVLRRKIDFDLTICRARFLGKMKGFVLGGRGDASRAAGQMTERLWPGLDRV